MVRQVTRFARWAKRIGTGIVHTHDFYTNVFGMIAATAAGVRVRIAERRETGAFRTSRQLQVERQVFRLGHAIVANSDDVSRQLQREGVPERCIVRIYNGVDLQKVSGQSLLTSSRS